MLCRNWVYFFIRIIHCISQRVNCNTYLVERYCKFRSGRAELEVRSEGCSANGIPVLIYFDPPRTKIQPAKVWTFGILIT